MIPLRAIPSLLISITILAVVAWMVAVGSATGSLYAEPPSRSSTAP